MSEIDELLTKPCWIIDILPEQVPGNGPGQFFAIEKAFLHDPDLRRKQADLLLKLGLIRKLAAAEGLFVWKGYDP